MAKYLGVPLEISNGNKIPRNGQPNIVTNPKFLGEETVSGNYKSIDNWRIQADPVFGFLSKFSPLNEAIGGTEYPKKTNIVASIGNIGTSYIDLQAMDDTGLNPLDVFEIGKAYEVIYTIWSSSIREALMMSASGESVAINTTKGTHRYSFIAQETQLKFFRNFNESNIVSTISDISVKEIAATETPTYGSPQLIPNSDFTTSGNWNFSDGTVSISNDELTFTNSSNETFASTTTNVLQKFKRYVVKIDITSLTGDNPRIRVVAGGDAATYSPYYSATGVYTHTFTAIDNNTNGKTQVYFYSDTTGGATVNSVTLYEVPYVMGTRELVKNSSFTTDTIWEKLFGATISDGRANIIGDGSSFTSINQNGVFTQGKVYELVVDVTIVSGPGLKFQQYGYNESIGFATQTGVYTFQFEAISNSGLNIGRYAGGTPFESYVNSVSVKELEYNYLQVADGGFKDLIKEGDVVFNTSTSTEGVVKQVVDNNVLLMSNDNFSTEGEFFSVFAPNNNTRGNQILKIDDLAAFDYDLPTGVKSSFWFSGAKNANNLSLYSIGESYEYHFTSKLIEEYIQRLDSQSATSSRLDIPLNKFRDGSSVTVINDIRIS